MARRMKNIAEIGMGPEPIGSDIHADSPNYDSLLGKALNWYNYMHDEKKATAYLLTFLKRTKAPKNMIEAVKNNRVITSYGWLARLIDRDAVLSVEHLEKLERYLKSMVSEEVKSTSNVAPKVEPKKTPRKPEAPAYMGEVDGAIDDMLADKPFDLDKFFELHNVPASGRKDVITLLKKYIKEFEAIQTDPELKEGFHRPVRLNRVIKALKKMVETVPVRKPRTVRVKNSRPPKLDKVKYLDKYKDIQSLTPAKIVGARKAWLFNTKYNEVIVFMAGAELSIKGTSVIGFDEKASFKMKLRNPDEVLPQLLKKDDKVLAELKTKRNPTNGRMSDSMIILRVE